MFREQGRSLWSGLEAWALEGPGEEPPTVNYTQQGRDGASEGLRQTKVLWSSKCTKTLA